MRKNAFFCTVISQMISFYVRLGLIINAVPKPETQNEREGTLVWYSDNTVLYLAVP